MNRYPYDEKALEKEYPLAARCARPEGSIVAVGDVRIGPGTLTLIAGRVPWKAGSSCSPPLLP